MFSQVVLEKCQNNNVVVFACSSNILKYTEAQLASSTCMIRLTEGLSVSTVISVIPVLFYTFNL